MSKYFLNLIVPLFLISSCSKNLEGINNDPNNPTDAPAATMLIGVEVANMNIMEGEIARTVSMWSGYFKGQQQQYLSYYQYLMIARNSDEYWQRVYSGGYKNLKLLKQKAKTINNIRLLGVAQVIEANLMGTAADLWGDIPYSQAADDNITSPAYDGQLSVYQKVQSLLDSAIINLGSTAFVDFAAQDIHFAGNMTKWIQTANTLKARFYLHTREYTKALSAAALGINAAANNWMAPHSVSGKGAYNLYYQFLAQDRPAWMDANGSFALSLLNAAGTRYRGNAKTIEKSRMAYLFTGTTNLNYTATGFFGQAAAFPLATFAENLLILAEADARVNGFTAGLARLNAYRAYMATGGYIGTGFLTAGNFKYDPYLAADFAATGIENPGSIPQDRALLKEILEEKYVTMIGSIEGYNDLRRNLKETDIAVPVPLNIGTQFPQRLLYPQVEVDLNKSVPNPIPSLFTPTPANQ